MTASFGASVADTIRTLGGGGARRVAESAGLVIERGEGSYVYDVSGTRYLDVIGGFGVASLGHAHPRWVEAVSGQARQLAVSALHTVPTANYLAALADVLPPSANQVALFSGGTEAVEVAIRLAQTATGRAGVLSFRESFHGKSSGVRYSEDPGAPEARWLRPPWLRSAEFPRCVAHDALTYRECDDGAPDVLAALERRDDLDDVAAVLVEPVLGTAGNIVPRRRFLRELRGLCDERAWLLILDESITGFGRTGPMFAARTFDVAPDILVLGKGMGGGFPLSAVAASADLWDASAFARPSATTTSYGGNPVACAAGLATLRVLTEDGFLEHAEAVAARLAFGLVELAAASRRMAHPRGVGMMLGFDLIDQATRSLASSAVCTRVLASCRDRGVLVVADVPRVRLSPPLTLSHEEADLLIAVLSEVLG